MIEDKNQLLRLTCHCFEFIVLLVHIYCAHLLFIFHLNLICCRILYYFRRKYFCFENFDHIRGV